MAFIPVENQKREDTADASTVLSRLIMQLLHVSRALSLKKGTDKLMCEREG